MKIVWYNSTKNFDQECVGGQKVISAVIRQESEVLAINRA